MTDKLFYRGDKELYRKAKAQAAIDSIGGQRKTIGQWIDEAIKEKLSRVGNIKD